MAKNTTLAQQQRKRLLNQHRLATQGTSKLNVVSSSYSILATSEFAPLPLAPMSPLHCLLCHHCARPQSVAFPYNTKIYI
jgi:hypothetical protein